VWLLPALKCGGRILWPWWVLVWCIALHAASPYPTLCEARSPSRETSRWGLLFTGLAITFLSCFPVITICAIKMKTTLVAVRLSTDNDCISCLCWTILFARHQEHYGLQWTWFKDNGSVVGGWNSESREVWMHCSFKLVSCRLVVYLNRRNWNILCHYTNKQYLLYKDNGGIIFRSIFL
jgi:hypothetical protein